jgi:uncharacterized membrane protein YoaK (UPF0700 family)
MISKFPGWVWVGAGTLAFAAGMINVTGFLGFQHQAVTHLTGNTSRVAEALATGDFTGAFRLAGLIGAFVAGTILSGFLIRDNALQIDGNYGAVLALESALLFAAVPLMARESVYGMYAAACASGLQNAMVSTYSGAAVRTTHLSGMFTDLGISLGHALRGLPVNDKRIRLCFLVISGFLAGGVAGTWAFMAFGYRALFFPAGVAAGAAVASWAHQARLFLRRAG